MTINEAFQLAQIFSIFILIFSVLYAAKQLKLTYLIHADNHDWNRRKAAQDLTMQINELFSDMAALHKKLNIINRVEPIPISEIKEEINNDPSVQLSINKVLNIYDGVARGVLSGIYDRSIIETARKSTMIKTYDAFSSYIYDRRKKRIPTLWNDYESIINQWKSEITKQDPRKKTGLSK